MAQRRGFGSVRKLPSGRWQARFTHPQTGKIQSAQSTFDTKAGAGRWLATMETDLDRGDALDLDRGKIAFGVYGKAWLDSRGDLRPKTMELYRYLFRQYLEPLSATEADRPDRFGEHSQLVRRGRCWFAESSDDSQGVPVAPSDPPGRSRRPSTSVESVQPQGSRRRAQHGTTDACRWTTFSHSPTRSNRVTD